MPDEILQPDDVIRCDACPVLCYIKDGRTGACDRYANRSGKLVRLDAHVILDRALEQGDRIELRGFGVFTVKPRKTGIGRNPRTGAEVAIPPGKAVRFKPGKELQSI